MNKDDFDKAQSQQDKLMIEYLLYNNDKLQSELDSVAQRFNDKVKEAQDLEQKLSIAREALEQIDNETWILKRTDLDRLLNIARQALEKLK